MKSRETAVNRKQNETLLEGRGEQRSDRGQIAPSGEVVNVFVSSRVSANIPRPSLARGLLMLRIQLRIHQTAAGF